MNKRPGGEIAKRELHFFWLLDCSGSMEGEKIQALNYAIREAIPLMRSEAENNPYAKVLVRCVTFSDTAKWHIAVPTEIEKFEWSDINASGQTTMGKALELVAEQLKIPPMTERALPPVLVLISDGQPTDDFNSGLNTLNSQPWGKKSIRIAIAIGEDADYDVLQKFIGNAEIKPLRANNADILVKHIKWASTAVLKAASSPATNLTSEGNSNLNIPVPVDDNDNNDEIW